MVTIPGLYQRVEATGTYQQVHVTRAEPKAPKQRGKQVHGTNRVAATGPYHQAYATRAEPKVP